MHRLVIARRQSIRSIDSGMRRHIEKKKFASTGQQDFQCRPRLMRRRCLGHEVADQRVQLPEAAERFAGNGARKTGIARLEFARRDDLCLGGIQRAALAQHVTKDFHRRRAGGDTGRAHALAFRMRRS